MGSQSDRASLLEIYYNLCEAIKVNDAERVHSILFRKLRDPVEFAHFRAQFINLVREIKRADEMSKSIDEYPVLQAAKAGSTEILTKLHLFGFSLYECDIDGCDPMMYACHQGHVRVVEWLLSRNYKIQCKDLQGWTAFHYAAATGNFPIVQLLFPHGKHIDEPTL